MNETKTKKLNFKLIELRKNIYDKKLRLKLKLFSLKIIIIKITRYFILSLKKQRAG